MLLNKDRRDITKNHIIDSAPIVSSILFYSNFGVADF